MNIEEFINTHCNECGSQRCTGANDELWRQGCYDYKALVEGVAEQPKGVDLSKITFMDYKKLMIGDWVKCYHPTQPAYPIKVTASLLNLLERQQNGLVKFSEPIFRIVEPIELTHEFIEKNGFEIIESNDMGYVHYHLDSVDSIDIKDYNGHYELTIWSYDEIQFMKNIKYVHEFQNALNICKVTEENDIIL